MRRVAPLLLIALALLASPHLGAAVGGTDIVALGRPLSVELEGPEYAQSRCLLAPLLATDKRTVAISSDEPFLAGDRILGINGEALSATGDRPLHQILIRYASDATVTVHLARAGSETDVTAACSDNRSYFAPLRAAAFAAANDDAATCADRMEDARKQHVLSAIWLNVWFSCSLKAGRISEGALSVEFYFIFHTELLENDFSPEALQTALPSVQEGAQILLNAGYEPLADELQQEFTRAAGKWPLSQGSELALRLTAPPMVSPATGLVQRPPTVTTVQSGRITQMTIDGQLAATHPVGCLPLSGLDSTRTPPDLYLGVKACLQRSDYRAAASLFALAGVESRFHDRRVLDTSAGQAGQVLIMNTDNGLPAESRQKLEKVVGEIAADTSALAQLCGNIRKVGYPTYYPEYMVLHGIHAFTAKPGDPTLVSGFDATSTWNSLLETYLNCREAPTPAAAGT